jgi:hypothetical protein
MRVKSAVGSVLLSLPVGLRRRALFLYYQRRWPQFGHPQSFSDKVNWRILNDRRAILEWTCDKLAMKDYVRNTVVDLAVPQTFWSGTDLLELSSIDLPPRWVLKPNHRSGPVHLGVGAPDVRILRDLTATWLQPFQAIQLGEWAYSRARPLLLVEEMLLGDGDVSPPDYKFLVMGGAVAMIAVDLDRHGAHSRRFYSADWTPLEASVGNDGIAPVQSAPESLDRMLMVAKRIGSHFDCMRVDLYDIGGQVFFGEVTPYPGSGLDRYSPTSFDYELGAKWVLPNS